MSSDIEKKKQYLLELYPNENWRRQVERMSESQIIAIYLDKKAKEQKPKPKKEREDERLF